MIRAALRQQLQKGASIRSVAKSFYSTQEATSVDTAETPVSNEELASVKLSPEVEKRLNEEFSKFVNDFAIDYDFFEEKVNLLEDSPFRETDFKKILDKSNEQKHSVGPDGNMRGRNQFPHVVPTDSESGYSLQELYLRRLFHAKTAAKGAELKDVYEPFRDLRSPPSIRETSISTLLAAGAHLGHSTSLLRQNNQPFLYGIRDGVHVIDLNQTLVHLRRAAKVIEGISEKGGVILFVGTLAGQERTVQVAADRANGYYVHSRWIPGTLTNATQISGQWARVELDMGDNPTSRELSSALKKAIVKPDVVVILNPVENRNLINECRLARVPTIGIIDTNSEPSLVSYPIPANDDSLRTSDLIAGVLSRAAKTGRSKRLSAFSEQKAQAQGEE